MTLAQPSPRTASLIIVAMCAVTCTTFSVVCLGRDATVAALAITGIVLSGIGIILIMIFMRDAKTPAPSQVVLNTIRPNRANLFPDRPPLPPYPPAFVPPFPVPPPQIIGESSILVGPVHGNPPSYEESAVIEDRRITENSNAPPAYNRTNFRDDNNIASFSPPPYYRPPSPFFATSVQTSTMYLSSESIAPSPIPISPIRVRSPSPVRRHPARKPRRSPRRTQETVIVIEDNQVGQSTSSGSPKTTSRTSLPQMIIDCSKAEPTLFSINGEESII
ncbi:unnamed protein product [Caenorhabditis sp. 36 PRJEB53466]|nr:unnamed protein product [Caenorhabditis sp. 36 PRJEB53466]